ncbi:MAG: serpin family protein [Clostridia bacterium]|nr:serpin family protein [Clostridia bacterium]
MIAVCLPVCLVAAVCLWTILPSVSNVVDATDLMAGVTANPVGVQNYLAEQSETATDFAIRLFKEASKDGGNVLLSPLSVMSVLAMTANGAEGDTLRQMEDVLGITRDEMNLFIYSYVNTLPQSDYYKLKVSNSIWINENTGLVANKDFLQTNADYYGAGVFKLPFNKKAEKMINDWTHESTDGMVPKIIDDIDPNSVTYLINALVFEAIWDDMYEKSSVKEGTFTKEDGTEQKAEFMYATDEKYIEDELATGFVKYYLANKYAFVALLPNEGVSVDEYINSLDSAKICEMLDSPIHTAVYTAIPKFETEHSVNMKDVLSAMGMTDAFDSVKADFSGIGDAELYIGDVVHKTHIIVNEKGTKAGAATSVELNYKGMLDEHDPRQVYLDRPFVYMIIDCDNDLPFFIGTMTDING